MTKEERFASRCQTITTDCNIIDILSCQKVVNFEILNLECKCTKSPTNTIMTTRDSCGDGGLGWWRWWWWWWWAELLKSRLSVDY
jgi:hypothetical protein